MQNTYVFLSVLKVVKEFSKEARCFHQFLFQPPLYFHASQYYAAIALLKGEQWYEVG